MQQESTYTYYSVDASEQFAVAPEVEIGGELAVQTEAIAIVNFGDRFPDIAAFQQELNEQVESEAPCIYCTCTIHNVVICITPLRVWRKGKDWEQDCPIFGFYSGFWVFRFSE